MIHVCPLGSLLVNSLFLPNALLSALKKKGKNSKQESTLKVRPPCVSGYQIEKY
jgi:hypothetical protein